MHSDTISLTFFYVIKQKGLSLKFPIKLFMFNFSPGLLALISSLVKNATQLCICTQFVKHIENSPPIWILKLQCAHYWPHQGVHVCNHMDVNQGGAGKGAMLLSNRFPE